MWSIYTERCVLFLDALDECAEPEQLERPLEILSKTETRCRVLVTGRPHAIQRDRLDKILGSRPAEYDLAPLAPLQRRGFIESWFGDDPDKSRVLGLLENHARFDDLTGNPQLLGLCCFAAADGDFDPKSLNRAALFKLITRHLLRTDWKRAANPNAPTLPKSQEDFLELVAAAAFKLFEKNPAGNRFGYRTWHMEADAAKKRMGLDGTEWSANNITEILRYGGLLVKPGKEDYAFLHRGFFEFLTALYLSWRIADGCKAVNAFLDKKVWDPAYKEVFAFLIGLLDDPQPLFAMLSDPNKDDRFRHRLELASYCLPEVKPSFQASAGFPEFREGLAKEARDYLDTLLPEDIAGKWWPVLNNSEIFAKDIYNWNETSFLGLERLNHAIAYPKFRIALDKLIFEHHELSNCKIYYLDEYLSVSKIVVDAVGHLGVSVITPNIKEELVRLLDDTWMLKSVLEVIEKLGISVVTPEILSILARLLNAPDRDIRGKTASVIGKMGTAASTLDILTALARLENDPDEYVQRNVASAIEKLDTTEATPEILVALNKIWLFRKICG